VRERAFAWRLFVTCWIVFALHFATNTVREIYPALSLGDHASFDVSEYEGLHPDLFRLPGRGTFINNNPGASMLGALPYLLARPAIEAAVARVQASRAAHPAPPAEYDTVYPLARDFYQRARERGLDVKFALAAAVMATGLMAPLSALAVVALFQLLLAQGVSRRGALALALLFAFATPVFYRTAQLNHNLLVTHAGWFAFLLLFRPRGDDPSTRAARFAGAGLLAGFAVLCDYSGVVSAAALGLYALAVWRTAPARRPAPLLAFAGGMAVCGAALLAYQWSCFGNPLLPAQSYMPDTDLSGAGYRGMGPPDPGLFALVLFSPRYGIFTSAPLLLLALWPPGWRRRDKGRGGVLPAREVRFALLFCAAVLVFTSMNQYARMQFNTGVRHAVPAVPFLFLLAVGTLRRLPRPAAVTFAALASFVSWCLAMVRDVETGRGVLETVIQTLRHGPTLPWLTTLQRLGYVPDGPWALLPLAAAALGVATLWWTLPRAEGAGASAGSSR
jgi:hypothetical protein